jgi:hypothetical protein
MATLDLVVLRHWPGFVRQADLCVAALGESVRFCRRSARLHRSAGLAVGHGGCGRTCPREGIGAA